MSNFERLLWICVITFLLLIASLFGRYRWNQEHPAYDLTVTALTLTLVIAAGQAPCTADSLPRWTGRQVNQCKSPCPMTPRHHAQCVIRRNMRSCLIHAHRVIAKWQCCVNSQVMSEQKQTVLNKRSNSLTDDQTTETINENQLETIN